MHRKIFFVQKFKSYYCFYHFIRMYIYVTQHSIFIYFNNNNNTIQTYIVYIYTYINLFMLYHLTLPLDTLTLSSSTGSLNHLEHVSTINLPASWWLPPKPFSVKIIYCQNTTPKPTSPFCQLQQLIISNFSISSNDHRRTYPRTYTTLFYPMLNIAKAQLCTVLGTWILYLPNPR